MAHFLSVHCLPSQSAALRSVAPAKCLSSVAAFRGEGGHELSSSSQRASADVHPALQVDAKQLSRREKRKVTHFRIRKKLNGTPERPRLAVFRSNKHIYAQVIDDTQMCTVASASTLSKELREQLELSAGATVLAAKLVGEHVAKACLERGITRVAFDRGGFLYHGRIQALADGAREAGLDF